MYWIYFDFDGTLVDSLELGVKVANILAQKYKYKNVDLEKINYYRDLTAQELLKEFDISWLKLLFIAPHFKKEFFKHIEELKPIDGIIEVIKNISNKNHLGILSSNSEKNIFHFLEKHKIAEYFSEVTGMRHLFGKDKLLKKIMKRKHIVTNKIIYIGDESRDVEAANRLGIKSIAVNWGFNSTEVLQKHNPTAIATNSIQLLEKIELLTK